MHLILGHSGLWKVAEEFYHPTGRVRVLISRSTPMPCQCCLAAISNMAFSNPRAAYRLREGSVDRATRQQSVATDLRLLQDYGR